MRLATRIAPAVLLGLLTACGGRPELSLDGPLVDEPDAAIIAGTTLERSIEVEAGAMVTQGTVEVILNHPQPDTLGITLVSAQGTRVAIEPRIAEGADDYRYAIPLLALQGEPMLGTWRLVVDASAATDDGTLYGWALDL